MASHAGLIYTLKTEKGYVAGDNQYTQDKNKALLISFEQFGWCSNKTVLKMLGYPDETAELETIVPSFESRLGWIENKLKLLGYKDYSDMAMDFYARYNCNNSDEYLEYIKYLDKQIKKIYNSMPVLDTLIIDNKEMELKRLQFSKPINDLEYHTEKLCDQTRIITKSTFKLKNLPLNKYFNLNTGEKKQYQYNYDELIKQIKQNLNIIDLRLQDNELMVYSNVLPNILNKYILSILRDFYEENQFHITRMFGSYILLKGNKEELKAIKATPIPIKYCPLMTKLLKEVGGDIAEKILMTLQTEGEKLQTEAMCDLINEVVIKSKYFDTNRPLNSCEANVLFGASETIASAFDNNLVDAAVIVSNNLGTIITTNSNNTQGAVKRMTGLFYTSPSEKLVETAMNENIIPVFPYTAEIDQIAGIKKAIELGYKKIAVSVAAKDNYLLKQIKQIEKENNVLIYKFGLCSTGIDEKTAIIMKDNADVIWSCASKQIKNYVEPHAIAQVGIKIPVHIMTSQGWQIVKNHLVKMNPELGNQSIDLVEGENKPVLLNNDNSIKVLKKKNVYNCQDCPRPCI